MLLQICCMSAKCSGLFFQSEGFVTKRDSHTMRFTKTAVLIPYNTKSIFIVSLPAKLLHVNSLTTMWIQLNLSFKAKHNHTIDELHSNSWDAKPGN